MLLLRICLYVLNQEQYGKRRKGKATICILRMYFSSEGATLGVGFKKQENVVYCLLYWCASRNDSVVYTAFARSKLVVSSNAKKEKRTGEGEVSQTIFLIGCDAHESGDDNKRN